MGRGREKIQKNLMQEFWEPTHVRGVATVTVWNRKPAFELRDLTHKLRADRAAGTGYQHHLRTKPTMQAAWTCRPRQSVSPLQY